MRVRRNVSCSRLRLLFLISSLCLYSVASAQTPNPALRPSPNSELRVSQDGSKGLPKMPPKKASKIFDAFPVPPWPPPDVDASVPAVSSNPTCVLPQVLSRAGRQVEGIVRDLDRFTATEIVQHHKVDKTGRLHDPQTSRFDYLVSLSRVPSGLLNVQEYRKGRTREDEFPDNVATEGTPSLVLVFHPKYAGSFSFTCEGLGEWQGKPAWQVRFEQRDIRKAMIAMVFGNHTYNIKIRGRAWIL